MTRPFPSQGSLDFTADWRRSDPSTSRDAAVFNLPNRSAHKALVLAALLAAGERGLTDFEAAAETGLVATSAGKRRLDLQRDGLVCGRMVVDAKTLGLVQDRRPSPSGALSLVWVAQEFARADAGGVA